MPSNFRRFAPMTIMLLVIWSFMVNFTFGMLTLSTVVALGVSVYQISVKKWQDAIEDDFSLLEMENLENE